ncbi:MAG: hypothetical protein E6I57_07340 [Chloroflexi bacterium]|nr:MAG: hypothetical protein E6I57_07340 [Chloroflexota bacterium]
MRTRALLVVLLLLWIAGTPGLGVDTRTSDGVGLGAIYGVAFLVAIVALVATWWRPRWVGPLAMIVGAAAVLLALADLAGLTNAVRPSSFLAALEIGVAIVGAALVWSGFRTRAVFA